MQRVAVAGEWEAENVGKAWRTIRHRALDAVFIVCNEFLFLLNKRRRRRFSSYRRRIISMMSIISIISMISIISIYRSHA